MIRAVKSNRLRWAGHIAYSALVAKSEEKDNLENISVEAETKRADVFSSLTILDKTE